MPTTEHQYFEIVDHEGYREAFNSRLDARAKAVVLANETGKRVTVERVREVITKVPHEFVEPSHD